jgi:O-antigen/teichoic acid export membrane protein
MELSSNIKPTSGFKLDLAANFAGVGSSALLQFACVPLYLKFLGIEAFGLIGFYLMLQAVLQVLDFGLSPTMNREMARYSVQPEKAAEARDLVRTLEAGYWLIGIAIGLVMFAAAPAMSTHWIKAGSIPARDIQHTLMLMGALTVFQWPASFYQGGLMGLGRQVLFNGLSIFFSTLSSVGSVLILWLVSPTIQVFFLWLAAVGAARITLLAALLWHCLPRANRASRFDFARMQSVWRFAAGMSGITVCALILTQSDKMIVSKLFSLKVFGYYSIAGMFGTGLSMVVTAVFNTIFPRFSALAAADEHALKAFYYRCTQLMAVLILPLAVVLAFFSTEILQLWTRNAEVARNAGPIAALLVVGSALNGLMNLPYALQLAYGWTSIGLRICIFLMALSIPSLWLMSTCYGAVGAACVWPGLNAVYMLVGVTLTHRRLLKGGAMRWWGEVSLPLIPIFLVVVVGKGLASHSMSPPLAVFVLSVLLFCATGAAALVSPAVRSWLFCRLLGGEAALIREQR